MQLDQIDIAHTPHLFYSGQDADGNWIETQVVDYAGGLRLRKRCTGGWQDLNLSYGVMQLYFVPELDNAPDETNSVLVADGFLRPQKMDWQANDWADMPFSMEHLSVALASGDYDAHAIYDNGIDRVEIDIAWRIGNSKQRYRVSSGLGDYVRLAAAVKDYKVSGVEVQQSIADFLGFALTQVIPGEDGSETTLYVFESDGQEITEADPVFEVDPYISLTETASTITIITDGDTLVFTVATYNATVIEQSVSRVVINETNLQSVIYPDALFVYGTGSSARSGNTYSIQNISTNFHWYPLTASANSDAAARTAQYQDTTLALTNGSAMTSGAGCTSIGESGFGSDGAWHYVPDTNDEVRYTLDRVRHKKVDMIHDFPVQSGDPASPTDYLLAYFKLDQAHNTTQIRDEVSGLNVGAGANTVDFISIDNRRTVHANSSAKRLSLPAEAYIGGTKFTISCDYKHVRGSDSDGYGRPFFYDDANNGLGLRFEPYYWGNSRLFFRTGWARTALTLTAPSPKDNTWVHLDVFVDMTKGFLGFAINNRMRAAIYDPVNIVDWGVLSGTYGFFIAYIQTLTSSMYVDNFKILNDIILPYGAYFTGNGAINTAMAHKDILLYAKMNNPGNHTSDIGNVALTAYGSPSLSPGVDGISNSAVSYNADNCFHTFAGTIMPAKGSLAFWFKPTWSSPDATDRIIFGQDQYGNFRIMKNSSDQLLGIFRDSAGVYHYVRSAALTWIAGAWYHVRLVWDFNAASGQPNTILFLNGRQITDTLSSATGPFTIMDTMVTRLMYIGGATGCSGVTIDELYLTSDHTPQIPTANGVPLHVPVLDRS